MLSVKKPIRWALYFSLLSYCNSYDSSSYLQCTLFMPGRPSSNLHPLSWAAGSVSPAGCYVDQSAIWWQVCSSSTYRSMASMSKQNLFSMESVFLLVQDFRVKLSSSPWKEKNMVYYRPKFWHHIFSISLIRLLIRFLCEPGRPTGKYDQMFYIYQLHCHHINDYINEW